MELISKHLCNISLMSERMFFTKTMRDVAQREQIFLFRREQYNLIIYLITSEINANKSVHRKYMVCNKFNVIVRVAVKKVLNYVLVVSLNRDIIMILYNSKLN